MGNDIRFRVILASAACALAAAACAGESPTDPAQLPISMQIVSGDGQAGPAHEELPNALVVQVLNHKAKPVSGQFINFVVVLGGGSTFAGASVTNADGIAQDYWTLGEPGPQQLEVRAVDPTTGAKLVFGVFTATAFPAGPEICDGLDNNGDGSVDDGLRYCINGNPAPNSNGAVCNTGFLDLDGDAANGCEVRWTPDVTLSLPNPVVILDGFRGQPPAVQQGQVMSASGIPIPGLEANVACIGDLQPCWLTANLSATTTPATLTLTADESLVREPGQYFALAQITIAGVGVAAERVVELRLLSLPDLQFSGSPQVVTDAGTVTVTNLAVLNAGFAASGPFLVGMCLSTTAAVADCVLDSQAGSTLPSLSPSSVTLVPPLVVPATQGVYYLLAMVDPPLAEYPIPESDETNNILNLGVIAVPSPPGP